MKRTHLAFTRTGSFVMTGGASVDIEDHMTWEDIVDLARRDEFAEFLPLSIKFFEDEWDFDPVEEEESEED